MGQFQKIRDEDHDDDDEERNALVHGDDVEGVGTDDFGQEHWRPAGLVLGCLTVREGFFLLGASVVFVILCYSALAGAVNAIAKRYLVLVTTSAFGTATSVGSVGVGIMDAWTTVNEFKVGNPAGFSQGPEAPFLTLGEGVLDLRWDTLLADPWELEEIALTSLLINIEQNADLSSNAKEIVQRLGTISSMQPGLSEPRPGQPHYLVDPATTRGLLSVPNKIVVDRLALFDLSIKLCIRPICDGTGPATYLIRRVMVFDIGKQQGGVQLYQLLEIVAQAALVAAIHAAPKDLGATLQRSIGQGLRRALDYASVHLDLGSGLVEIRDWTSNQLGRLEDTVGNAVGPGGSLSQGSLLNDMESLRGNASSALSDLGLELGGAAGHVAEGLEHSADSMRGKKAEAVAAAASTAMNDVSHEAEVLGDRMSDALSALEGSSIADQGRGTSDDSSSFGMKGMEKGERAGSALLESLTSGAEQAASSLMARQQPEQPSERRSDDEALRNS